MKIYDVDPSIPEDQHDFFNDLPLFAESKIPSGGKFKKLLLDLEPKKNYVIHYQNLRHAIYLCYKFDKILKAMTFTQSD